MLKLFFILFDSDGLLYRPDSLVRNYFLSVPFFSLFILCLNWFITLSFEAKGAPIYVIFPLQMCLTIIQSLLLDIPFLFVTYFYMTRFKPPNFDIRISGKVDLDRKIYRKKNFVDFIQAYIDVLLTVFLALGMLFSQTRNFKAFIGTLGRGKIGSERRKYRRRQIFQGFLAIFPFLVFIPTMKILATVKTMLNVGKGPD